jgi:oxygen-independent coproporphyrinogen III oxidase
MSLGIYISVPFCRTKCSYCNFASDVFSRALFERYVDRLCADIANTLQTVSQMGGALDPDVDSIYLGGGTPTVLDSSQLQRIFSAVGKQFSVSPRAEITVECAPGTLTPEMIETLVLCGANRVSLGVQSFVDVEAAAVGRLHKRAIVLEETARLRAAGIANVNIDLIAGLPHQTVESWRRSVAEAIATEAPHVSVYMLEVDEESRLGRELIAGGKRYHAHFVPDEDAIADFYLEACAALNSAGIAQYEISNFAREGFESQHNLKYWTRQPYLGFGVDAHSMLRATREPGSTREPGTTREGHDFSRANNAQEEDPGFSPRGPDAIRFAASDSLEKYVAGKSPERSVISCAAALEETFFLGLRLTHGISLQEAAEKFGSESVNRHLPAVAEMVADKLIERDGNRIGLTPRGRLLSNEVFQHFLSPLESLAK